MTVPMEKVLRTYLGSLDLDAAVVVGETPKNIKQAWVKITQLDDRAVGVIDADHFHNHHVQLDCYASQDGSAGQGEAQALYAEVRAALVAMPAAEHDEATVTAVRFGACPRVPDSAFNPARQRYVIDAHIYAHERSDAGVHS